MSDGYLFPFLGFWSLRCGRRLESTSRIVEARREAAR